MTRADVPFATDAFARFLIGTLLIRRYDDDLILAGRIVETEAYLPDDPASHAYRGQTPRNRTMFAANMHAYVYLIYGTAYCLNVSSEAAGVGAAILVRSLEPVAGVAKMRSHRGNSVSDRDLLRGPGRLCAAFEIDRRFDGADLETDERLWLSADDSRRPAIGISARIGLTKGADVRHRYYARGSRFLSGPRALSPDV